MFNNLFYTETKFGAPVFAPRLSEDQLAKLREHGPSELHFKSIVLHSGLLIVLFPLCVNVLMQVPKGWFDFDNQAIVIISIFAYIALTALVVSIIALRVGKNLSFIPTLLGIWDTQIRGWYATFTIVGEEGDRLNVVFSRKRNWPSNSVTVRLGGLFKRRKGVIRGIHDTHTYEWYVKMSSTLTETYSTKVVLMLFDPDGRYCGTQSVGDVLKYADTVIGSKSIVDLAVEKSYRFCVVAEKRFRLMQLLDEIVEDLDKSRQFIKSEAAKKIRAKAIQGIVSNTLIEDGYEYDRYKRMLQS